MRIDALYLENDNSCVGSQADFSVLPYYDGNRDLNASVPYLAEATRSEPFAARSFPLPKGIHLHWALPKGLTKSMKRPILEWHAYEARGKTAADWEALAQIGWTKAINDQFASIVAGREQIIAQSNQSSDARQLLLDAEGLLFPRNDHLPPVPNRWLVSRYQGADLDTQWIIESDYLYPAKQGSPLEAITYPLRSRQKGDPPFRYLGRNRPLANWTETGTDEYLYNTPSEQCLTARGYGELAFAAFYPNCFSVFGFWDDSPAVLADPTGYSYEVMGFYRNGDWDYLQLFLADLENRNASATLTEKLYRMYRDLAWLMPLKINDTSIFSDDQLNLLRGSGWISTDNVLNPKALDPSEALNTDQANLRQIRQLIEQALQQSVPLPAQSNCYGRIEFTEKPADRSLALEDFDLALGNSGTEALAAYLSRSMASEFNTEVEEQLETLKFFDRMDHLQTDIVAKFEEYRHQAGFTPRPGGMRWALRPETAADASDPRSGTAGQVGLPDNFAHLLNQLNIQQRQYDGLNRALSSHRQQLYADWNKYQASRYLPVSSVGRYPNINLARSFLEEVGLQQIDELSQDINSLKTGLDSAVRYLRQEAFKLQLVTLDDIADWTALWQTISTSGQEILAALAPDSLDELLLDTGKSDFVQRANTLLERKDLFLDPPLRYPGALPNEESLEIAGFYDRIAFFTAQYHPDPVRFFDHNNSYLRLNRLLLEAALPELARRPNYRLHPYPDQRFWRPNDPVVLFAGNGMKISPRYDESVYLTPGGFLDCRVVVNVPAIVDADSANAVFQQIRGAYAAGEFPVDTSYDLRLYPLLMDWQVEFFPQREARRPGGTADGYTPTYLQDLEAANADEDAFLFTTPLEGGAHNYWGTTIVSGHSGRLLEQNLIRFITNRLLKMGLSGFGPALLPGWNLELSNWSTGLFDEFLSWFLTTAFPGFFPSGILSARYREQGAFTAFIKWFIRQMALKEASPEKQKMWEDFHLAIALLAYEKLAQNNYLSQSLGGFTRGLLMLAEGPQLDIQDPLGFAGDQGFAATVAQYIGHGNRYSVLPRNAFFPIRAGGLELVRLRLIDHFGLEIVHLDDIQRKDIAVSAPLTPPGGSNRLHAMLPARFSQPVRLNFRWLSALDDDLETNDHPATTPICGWILINEIENSLMIYDQPGRALGFIGQEIRRSGISVAVRNRWRVFPGYEGPVIPAAIENVQLRRMVLWLLEKANITAWIAQVNTALDQIEPDNFEQHDDLAYLMSRPIALVRASLQWETHGQVAIHQGWNEFRSDLQAFKNEGPPVQRDRHGVENLQASLRLGDAGQLNDGLIGFWIDDAGGQAYQNGQLHTPTADKPEAGNTFEMPLQLDPATGLGARLGLSILMDPRGVIHAHSKLSPVQSLALPADQYRQALAGIEVAFLTAPLLTPDSYLHLSLPQESGFAWSWLSRQATHWSELSTDSILRLADVQAEFGQEAADYWAQLVERSWIELLTETKARIVAVDQRPQPEDPTQDTAWPDMEAFLDRYRIGPFQANTAFAGKQVIREGWLKLKPLDKNE